MTAPDSLAIVGWMAILAGIHFAIIGGLQMQRRPRLVPSWVTFLPATFIILPLGQLIFDERALFVEDPIRAAVMVAAVAAILLGLAWLYYARGGDYTILNLSYKDLEVALNQTMRRHRIRYRLARADRGWTKSSKRYYRYDAELREPQTIWAFVFNISQRSCTLKLQHRQLVRDNPALLQDFTAALAARRSDAVPTGGIMQLFGAVALLAIGVWLL